MMAITIPEEYGGLGLGYTARMIAVEEISRVSVATAMMLQVFALGIEPIVKFGSDELKKKYLPGTGQGRNDWPPRRSPRLPVGPIPPASARPIKKRAMILLSTAASALLPTPISADTITILAKSEENPKAFCAFVIDKDMADGRPPTKSTKSVCAAAIPVNWHLKIVGFRKLSCWEKKERVAGDHGSHRRCRPRRNGRLCFRTSGGLSGRIHQICQ